MCYISVILSTLSMEHTNAWHVVIISPCFAPLVRRILYCDITREYYHAHSMDASGL